MKISTLMGLTARRAWGRSASCPRLRQWQAFTRALDTVQHASTRELLARVRDVYALDLIEKDLAWYLIRGVVSSQRARAVTAT